MKIGIPSAKVYTKEVLNRSASKSLKYFTNRVNNFMTYEPVCTYRVITVITVISLSLNITKSLSKFHQLYCIAGERIHNNRGETQCGKCGC